MVAKIAIPVKGAEYITGFRGCSLPPQIEDCGRINGLVLLSRHPPMGVFETINSLGLLPRFPALQVFEIINGLGHRAILHFASQRNVALSVLRCEGCSQLFPQWGISSTDGLTVRASTR